MWMNWLTHNPMVGLAFPLLSFNSLPWKPRSIMLLCCLDVSRIATVTTSHCSAYIHIYIYVFNIRILHTCTATWHAHAHTHIYIYIYTYIYIHIHIYIYIHISYIYVPMCVVVIRTQIRINVAVTSCPKCLKGPVSWPQWSWQDLWLGDRLGPLKQSYTGWWFGTFIFHNIWDNPSQLTNIFQMGWNHQPV